MSKSLYFKVSLIFMLIFLLTTKSLFTAEKIESNTLILFNNSDLKIFLEHCEELRKDGFIPLHKIPPATIIGYDPGEISISFGNKRQDVLLVTQEPVDISSFQFKNNRTKFYVNAWNTLLLKKKGIIPKDIVGLDEDHYGQPSDVIFPSDINDVDKLNSTPARSSSSSKRLAPPLGAMVSDTSEFFIGDVVVTVICPESNGAVDPNIENWTTAEENTITNRVILAFDQMITEEGRGLLNYTYDFRYKEPCSYEAVTRWWTEDIWISEIMNNLGYSGYSTAETKTRAFCNDQRITYNTDWAHVIFMVDTTTTGPQRAYAMFGGPYNLNDNQDSYPVIMHETGHIFYADDEYLSSSCTCTGKSGYLNFENQNCELASCLLHVSCRMISNIPPFCVYSKGQIGWTDSDSDLLPDVIDTFPNTTLTVYPPDPSPPGFLTYRGSSTVVPLPNKNPYGLGNDISINTISNVEYRMNYGPWIPAIPTDGTFDEPVEPFRFTTPYLAPGTYYFEVRATNNYGNIETTYATDSTVVFATGSTVRITSRTLMPLYVLIFSVLALGYGWKNRWF